MARRSAYETLLPFDPSFGFVSDVDMWMRMCLYYDVAYIRKPLIILDHSPTPERSAGKFNWTSVDMVRRMQEANIRRFYKDQPDRLRSELRHHAWLTEKIFAKHLYGRMRRSDWDGLKEGLQLCRNLQWPLKGLWVLGNF